MFTGKVALQQMILLKEAKTRMAGACPNKV